MTAKELFDEVAALGFKDGGELDSGFIYAVNRAMLTLTLERAPVSHTVIPIAPLMPLSVIHLKRIASGSEETFVSDGASVSFTVSGKGSYKVSLPSGDEEEYTYSGTSVSRGHSVVPGARITFSASAPSYVFNFATFRDSFPNDGDIPRYSEWQSYSISRHVPDFMRAESPPLDKDGNPIRGASVSGDILRLPSSFEGTVELKYTARPTAVNLDNLDSEIGILPELSHLLPLLVAAYVHLDEDAELGQYYMELYNDALLRLRRYSSAAHGEPYGDVLGWC